MKKFKWLIDLVLRACLGFAVIYLINVILSRQGMQSPVGINFYTLGVSAVLGIPGVALLYGIGMFFNSK